MVRLQLINPPPLMALCSLLALSVHNIEFFSCMAKELCA
jgi:hypothetical protein